MNNTTSIENKYVTKQYLQTYFTEKKFDATRASNLVSSLAAKGYTIEGYNDQPKKETNPVKEVAQGLGKAVLGGALNLGSTAQAYGGAAVGYALDRATPNTPNRSYAENLANTTAAVKEQNNPWNNVITGQDTQVRDLSTATGLKQAAGDALATGANFIGIGKAAAGAKGILQAGKAGAAIGGTSALGNSMEDANKGIGENLTDAALGAGTGFALGAGATAAIKGVGAAAKLSKKGVAKGKEGISPTPTFEKALGEVSIAKKVSQLPKFEKALSAIDTKDVKTFSELNDKFKKAIPDLAAKVDNELLKDINTYKIQDLLIPQKTKGGKEIKVDYITRSLDGLKDLYTKLGDDVAKADIEEFANKAETVGLTRKEVNDLARLYNTEYGSKAFTATGDIKTGFNAELYESTRKGLKDIARNGLGGDEAKALDDKLTAVYDAQKLTEKNTDAVNALKQRIEEKGWIGKGIRGAFELSDLFTGGAVRAVRDTVLARGNAQKLQNVLELENKLQKNLEVINKAIKAPTEAKAVEILNTLPKEKVNSPTDLFSEAKKYKSAEEFIKSRIFTNEELVKKGLSKEEVSRYREVVDKQLPINKTTFLDKTKGQFNSIREVGGYKVRARMYDNNPWQIVEDLAEIGDGESFRSAKSIKEFRTRDELWKYIKDNPKSQLTDLWNKAQGKSPKK